MRTAIVRYKNPAVPNLKIDKITGHDMDNQGTVFVKVTTENGAVYIYKSDILSFEIVTHE